jgi:hypothetical protein
MKVNRKRLAVIDDSVSRKLLAMLIKNSNRLQPVEKPQKSPAADAKSYAMKAGGFAVPTRFAGKKSQLGSALRRADHQRAAFRLGPAFVFGDNF